MIRIFYDNTKWRLRHSRKIKRLIAEVIKDEKFIPGDLNFIFMNDKSMIEINREFLKHNYYTDVISFREVDELIVSGEVYIGIETVKRNSLNYNVSYRQEVLRVLIHGALHLCGYEDSTGEGRNLMRLREDFWLNYFERKSNEL